MTFWSFGLMVGWLIGVYFLGGKSSGPACNKWKLPNFLGELNFKKEFVL